MKTCTKCRITKSSINFCKDKTRKDGLFPWCKECKNNQKKEDYKNEPWKKLFLNINQRCNNPKSEDFIRYGKRGIKNKFKNSNEIKYIYLRDKAYLMTKPSIDRIDNDGDYSIKNCQFIEMELNRIKDRCKAIIQKDLQGNFIKEWKSRTEASKTLKINKANIFSVISGKRNHAGRFKWELKELEIK